MIKVRQKGDFVRTTRFLTNAKKGIDIGSLEQFCQRGVDALSSATPVDTGETANSWYSELEQGNGYVKISFNNSNIQNGVPIAIILQYGHATRTGGWIEGRDYINPAIQPIFDEMTKAAWREVTKR